MNKLAKFKRECGLMLILHTILYFGLLLVVNNNRIEINTLRGQVLVVAEAANNQTEINKRLLEVIKLHQTELEKLAQD